MAVIMLVFDSGQPLLQSIRVKKVLSRSKVDEPVGIIRSEEVAFAFKVSRDEVESRFASGQLLSCLLYTSDAADE